MERRGQERDLRIPNYTPHQIIQESPVKLPLAPILSTPPDRLIRGNAMASTRRGSSIFSPTKTLDPPQHHPRLSPPPPHQPPVQKEPTSDPDPPTPTTAAAASNSKIPTAPAPAPPPPPPQAAAGDPTGNTTIRYRECLKNHAASMGGRVVDGCGEFMPSGEEGLEALRCAACDCHRNFHRKEIGGGTQQSRYNNSRQSPLLQTQTPTTHHKRSHSFATSGGPTPPTMVNFAGNRAGAEAETSSEHLNMLHHSGSGGGVHAAEQPSKKRFRTKFSQDQKDRMHEFASKIGWRMQKQDDERVKQFCSEIGVQRQAFKVWMHNIKQATKKKESDDHTTS